MLAQLFTPQIIFFIILILAFGLLLTERLRNDIVAVLIILALAITGLLEPEEALSGFSSEPAIVVAAIFVLSAGLHQTGLSELTGGWIGRLAGSGYTRAVAVIMSTVALLSAFTHHLTTTAVMLPVTLNLSRERQIAPSKLLMPLSFAASLGTTITIIGAPAFLIASGVLQRAGRPGLGVFSIAPIGLSISVVGTIFMVLVGRWLLPQREGGDDPQGRFRLDDYFTELTIVPDSPFIGRTIEELTANNRFRLNVVGWIRDNRQLTRPFDSRTLQAGDVLRVRTTPEELVAIRQEPGIELHAITLYGSDRSRKNADGGDLEEQLVQVVVAPNSDLINRTLGSVDFRRRYGAVVLSLWRRRSWLDQELAKIKLRAGDVLVLEGDEEALARVQNDPQFLMMIPFQGELHVRRKAGLAGAIMLATIVLAASTLLSIEMAALAGAVAMVLTRCLTARQAYRSIDARIYIFIAGALPLGTAMEKSGAAKMMADWLQAMVGGWNQLFVLMALFTIVAILTQFMSDSATTALFAPVSVVLAQALGHSPEAYVVTVAMASVASFLTPIGHHGNLLVYGPGRYKFRDFVIVGTPLTILVGMIVAFMAPILWPA